jgi:hypothetical protein
LHVNDEQELASINPFDGLLKFCVRDAVRQNALQSGFIKSFGIASAGRDLCGTR